MHWWNDPLWISLFMLLVVVPAASIGSSYLARWLQPRIMGDDLEPNRFEVIDETGRAYSRWGVDIELHYQDDGRTLKVFVTESAPLWSGQDEDDLQRGIFPPDDHPDRQAR